MYHCEEEQACSFDCQVRKYTKYIEVQWMFAEADDGRCININPLSTASLALTSRAPRPISSLLLQCCIRRLRPYSKP